jgi:hypothetical protein
MIAAAAALFASLCVWDVKGRLPTIASFRGAILRKFCH